MTTPAFAATSIPSYRLAGWAAIASGAIGLLAHGFLWAFLVSRLSGGDERTCMPLLRTHDAGVIFQALFLIPVVIALGGVGGQHSRGGGRATVAMGVMAASLIVLSLLLVFVNVATDGTFMVSQGVLGIWLIVASRLASNGLPRYLKWLGTVAGVGLVLVAAFGIGYFIFVDSRIGPVPFDYQPPKGTEMANDILHGILLIGSFMGVTTLPIWTALVGVWLLRKRGRTEGAPWGRTLTKACSGR